jgi:thioredoxin reductase (NADPH)
VHFRQNNTGASCTKNIRYLFVFVGADPNTAWLEGCAVQLDDKGFVLTGDNGAAHMSLQTSMQGVFAIGDVRAGSTKRIAAAVGEGAAAVAQIHAYLAS